MKQKQLMWAHKINGDPNTFGLVDVNCNPPELFCLCTEEVADEILKTINRAKRYDELEAKVVAFYPIEEDSKPEVEGDLIDIGEMVARHFGFL